MPPEIVKLAGNRTHVTPVSDPKCLYFQKSCRGIALTIIAYQDPRAGGRARKMDACPTPTG
jgi:hypothetical protein